MLSARSPKYPGLYDEDAKVMFGLRAVEVTEEQALILAERPYVDGILIGEFDDEGRPVGELPAKDWRKAQRREGGEPNVDADPAAEEPQSDEATPVAEKKTRRT